MNLISNKRGITLFIHGCFAWACWDNRGRSPIQFGSHRTIWRNQLKIGTWFKRWLLKTAGEIINSRKQWEVAREHTRLDTEQIRFCRLAISPSVVRLALSSRNCSVKLVPQNQLSIATGPWHPRFWVLSVWVEARPPSHHFHYPPFSTFLSPFQHFWPFALYWADWQKWAYLINSWWLGLFLPVSSRIENLICTQLNLNCMKRWDVSDRKCKKVEANCCYTNLPQQKEAKLHDIGP